MYSKIMSRIQSGCQSPFNRVQGHDARILTSLGHGSVKLWWEVPERIESDLSIVDYRESKLRWQPKIKDEFELNLVIISF